MPYELTQNICNSSWRWWSRCWSNRYYKLLNIGVASHLVPYLPGHPVVQVNTFNSVTNVAASPYGSASILPITWM